MPTHFLSDILHCHDNRLNKDYYSEQPAGVKIVTRAGDNTTITHKATLSKESNVAKGAGDTSVVETRYNIANGTTVEYNGCKDTSFKFKLTNGSETTRISWLPAQHNGADKALKLQHETAYCFGKGCYCSTETLKYGKANFLGPLGYWTTLALKWSTENHKRTLGFTENFQYENYHLGVKGEVADFKKLSEIYVQAAFKKQGTALYYGKYDVLNKQILLGTSFHCPVWKDAWHALAVDYDTKAGAKKGCCGQPFTARWAVEGKLNDAVSLKTRLTAGSECHLSQTWIHQFTSNIRFLSTSNVDLCKLFSCCKGKCAAGPGSVLDYGLSVQFTL